MTLACNTALSFVHEGLIPTPSFRLLLCELQICFVLLSKSYHAEENCFERSSLQTPLQFSISQGVISKVNDLVA